MHSMESALFYHFYLSSRCGIVSKQMHYCQTFPTIRYGHNSSCFMPTTITQFQGNSSVGVLNNGDKKIFHFSTEVYVQLGNSMIL